MSSVARNTRGRPKGSKSPQRKTYPQRTFKVVDIATNEITNIKSTNAQAAGRKFARNYETEAEAIAVYDPARCKVHYKAIDESGKLYNFGLPAATVNPATFKKHLDAEEDLFELGQVKTSPKVKKTKKATPKKSPSGGKKSTGGKVASPAKQKQSSGGKAASPAKQKQASGGKVASPAKKATSPARKATSPAKKSSGGKKKTSPAVRQSNAGQGMVTRSRARRGQV